MKDIDNIIFNEEWDEVLKELIKYKNLIMTIDPYDLAWKRFQYQLAENGIQELVSPFGKYSDLIKLISYCKKRIVGQTIPQATAFQQIEQIKSLLNKGHNIDEQDFGERTGLLVAATLNDYEMVKFFVGNGAFVSFYDQDNLEAIDFTTSNEIKNFLKNVGGKTEKERNKEYDDYCESREYWNVMREINLQFMKGAETGNINQMKDALQKSSIKQFTLNFAYPVNGWTAMHFAVKNNDKELIDFLIKQGIDINKKNIDGSTAIDLAKQLNRAELFNK